MSIWVHKSFLIVLFSCTFGVSQQFRISTLIRIFKKIIAHNNLTAAVVNQKATMTIRLHFGEVFGT